MRSVASLRLKSIAACSISLLVAGSAHSQDGGCTLVTDTRNPSEKMLQCGDDLTVRTAKGTRYRQINEKGGESPRAIQVNSGAVMIEFNPSVKRHEFQILTPHAIAAVRGTKWVVEVNAKQTSTLVLSGGVSVSHLQGGQSVILEPGEGADVTSKVGKIEVKHWPQQRVQALLARFGE